ncbi:hypothetical protein [Microbacterium sp. Se5.02b]|uniref:hypothetical protein n=1 Tax=Microbacterium sp. Se5.02b TaxID=2864103 RepID=UPI001C690219|nr:hypothetical protein [Microbacterium sp. Se5.02b]QYM62977.1 hypothetical protein K1X59_11530 [Microbacterium sp. Se5.02b]
MASALATRPGKSFRGVFQGVLLVGLLATGIIVGLLAMHTLNLHGTAAADAPTSLSASVSEPAAAHHVSAAAHDSGHGSGDRDMSCAGCGTDDHAGMAMACVLALLLLLLLVAPPHLLRAWTRLFLWSPLDGVPGRGSSPRALSARSLHQSYLSRHEPTFPRQAHRSHRRDAIRPR